MAKTEVRKKLSEKQFTAVTETQKALVDARNAFGAAQLRLQEADKAANLMLEVVADAHQVDLKHIVNLDSESKELVLSVPEAPAAEEAPAPAPDAEPTA